MLGTTSSFPAKIESVLFHLCSCIFFQRRRRSDSETWQALRLYDRDTYRNFNRKKPCGVRSEVVGKFYLASAYGVALLLWLGVVCGNTDAQTRKTGGSSIRSSHTVVSCNKDSQCPSGQRCGFTSGCDGKGICIVPSGKTSCIDPGGRCGCDGRPVDIFCGVGSRTEFTSAPVNAVGPCPRPCTAELGCGSRLVCEKGFCVKP
jgi:hypothetical protein